MVPGERASPTGTVGGWCGSIGCRRTECGVPGAPGNSHPMASSGVPSPLAVEIALQGRRPRIPQELRDLVREMSRANPLWGTPRIHGELLKLGIEVSQSTVANYMPRCSRPPSQSWKTFLRNHTPALAAIDGFRRSASSCSFAWLSLAMIAGSWSRSASRLIRPQRGLAARSRRHSLGMSVRGILSRIGTASTARPLKIDCVPWAFETDQLLLDRPGRTVMPKGSFPRSFTCHFGEPPASNASFEQ
jgi:hypothetical protein